MRILNIISGILLSMLIVSASGAKIIEKVVAYVEDEAITLTDLCQYWKSIREIQPEITLKDALEAMLNRKMILHRTRQLNLTADSEDELIDLYIRFTIRPKVSVTKQQVRQYYFQHRDKLKGLPIERVQEQIIQILYEKKTNELLKQHLRELSKELSVGINGPLKEDLCTP